MDRQKQYERLAQQCRQGIAALYGDEAKVVVFGEGSTAARMMLVGEAPGEQETLHRRPFVGKAGQNLDGFLAVLGLSREQLYITNVVKFRPCVYNPDTGRWRNRPPGKEETMLCLPWLMQEVQLVKPEIIVTLGNVALKAFLGKDASVGVCHGQLQHWPDAAIFPLYHPASIIYNRSLQTVYDADLQALSRVLDKNKERVT